jgi:serine/threonine protein kinase
MTREEWQKVEAVLQEALDRPAQDRKLFLDAACTGDSQLLRDATSFVDAYEEAGDFIELPALTQDAPSLVGENLNGKVGEAIGPYKILSRLGMGGMSEVYLAQDTRLDRLVALKILPPYFASDDEGLSRFQREAKAASALNHPNILTIHELGELAGIRFIATEYVEGVTIRQLIRTQQLSLAEILDIAKQVCSGLATAHAAGIIHCDIKPENIMRRADGLVKILDFGIAKLMQPELADYPDGIQTSPKTGVLLGTISYMSPEQARGLPVDERTDIWSLGVVIYEMLAQRLPFTGPTDTETIAAILEQAPMSLSDAAAQAHLSPLIEQTVSDCLSRKLSDRIQSANELLTKLKRVEDELEKAATFKNAFARSLSHRYSLPLLGVILLLVVAITGIIVYQRFETKVPANASSRPAAPATNGKLYTQMTEAEQLDFVDQQEQRISTMIGDRPVKLNADAVRVIKGFVDRYVARNGPADDLGKERLAVVYTRARSYVPLIARSFAARKVPIIIGIYLPVIESAYRNCYENSIGAKGLFQFMPQTANHYGVATEDMCDVEKMTPAAAHYLADSMAELGEDSQSMTLVLLSYNRGAASVRDNLRQLRDSENYERNFWTLFAHRNELDDTFRRDGAHYVPNFFAAAIIGENPQNFGLPEPPLSQLAQ